MKYKNKIFNNFGYHFYKNGIVYIVILIIVVVPLILYTLMSLTNTLNYYQSVLSYFGVALGIFSSFLTYRHEQKRVKEERIKEIKPKILIQGERICDNCIKIIVKSMNDRPLYNLYVGTECIKNLLKKEYTLYLYNEDDYQDLDDYLEEMYQEIPIKFKDNIPKDLFITCSDTEHRLWGFEYRCYDENELVSFHLIDSYLL